MGLVLLLVFLVVPFVELAVIVSVADAIGLGFTLLLLIAFSVAGAWLVKVEGLGVWRRVQGQLAAGELPTTELVNGLLILVAGALLLTPGFVTDTLGLLLLVPPTRAVVRTLVLRRFERRLRSAFAPGGTAWAGPGRTGFATARVFSGEATYQPSTARIIDVHEVGPESGEEVSGGR